MCWSIGPCDRATRDRASMCWMSGPCIRMSGTTAVLHRNCDAPNAARAGAAAGAADDEAAARGGATAGGGTVKTLGVPPAAGTAGGKASSGGTGGVGFGSAALGLGGSPPTARRASHATSSAGFVGRRSGASPRVFTYRARLAFTNFSQKHSSRWRPRACAPKRTPATPARCRPRTTLQPRSRTRESSPA